MSIPPSRRETEADVIDELRADPEYAAAYLNAVLEDGDQEEVMQVMRRITIAFGGVAKLADQTDLNAKTLYRTLSARGNPELKSLMIMLKALGFQLAVKPIETAHV